MKIKNISCTQFAGVRDRNITFNDGINVVFGKNESGKSTLVDLISRTLFQNARIDGRSDKEFLELYFPCKRRGSSITGNFADGKITFEDETGTYTLSKEWSKEPRCTLSTPDGTLRDQKSISAELKRIIVYGEGVYSDMLLSSQRNTDSSLQTLLDASRKTEAKQEISDAVSQAFAESDGISIDAIGQAIEAKISGIAGKHWDAERSQPARKSGRWATGLGDILKAYYALEDAGKHSTVSPRHRRTLTAPPPTSPKRIPHCAPPKDPSRDSAAMPECSRSRMSAARIPTALKMS